MIYLILDVYYQNITDNKTIAKAAGIRFGGIDKHHVFNEYKIDICDVKPYQSGQFYQREMPCLLALIEQINEPFDVIIIDGYVYLDGVVQAGLGKHLYDNLSAKKPIVGIAKTHFYGMSQDFAVYRGVSKHPLYVTCIDFDINIAKELVQYLQGCYRMPDVVTMVDKLTRR